MMNHDEKNEKLKKEYICPELTLVRYTMCDVLAGSVEDLGGYDDIGDDWDLDGGKYYLPPEEDFYW